MELWNTKEDLENGYGERLKIEDLFVFPLLKSSDLGNRRTGKARVNVIVTQYKVGQATDDIQDRAPLTWRYLEQHAVALDSRKSIIYRNKPRFSIFGTGNSTNAARCGRALTPYR
ncbi:MAG: hypothetical protein GDA36_07455 [Rhodobacteraceae bacterium]|nr:hypothetical protein [Paracoccaceae bacterium]